MGRLGKRYPPSALLIADCVTPVALCLIVTSAPGTTPPAESTMTPEMVDVVAAPWA